MVSEGVDIPRLAVGVYATSVSTALFFAQAVGRFVRARRRGETASVFLPSVPVLLSYAAELEAERDHVLRAPGAAGEEDELALAEAQRQRDTPDARSTSPPSRPSTRPRTSTGCCTTAASSAPPRGRLAGGRGLPRPARPARAGPGPPLLRKRQDAQLPLAPAAAVTAPPPASCRPRAASAPQCPCPPRPPVSRQALAALRKELNGLVGAWSHRTGQPHGVIHTDLRRTCGGPPLPQATADQIRGPHRHHPPLGHLRPLARTEAHLAPAPTAQTVKRLQLPRSPAAVIPLDVTAGSESAHSRPKPSPAPVTWSTKVKAQAKIRMMSTLQVVR